MTEDSKSLASMLDIEENTITQALGNSFGGLPPSTGCLCSDRHEWDLKLKEILCKEDTQNPWRRLITSSCNRL